jgi:CheY-like chemotaxis protein
MPSLQCFFAHLIGSRGRAILNFEKWRLSAPPAGFEPAHTAPEAVALSPELWGPALTPATAGSREDPGAATANPAGPQPGYQPQTSADTAAISTHHLTGGDNLARVTQGLGRVLVVDDDEVIRQLIAVNLTLEGFDVVTAVDGRDCLEKVIEADPDVITLDVMMPRLDGWVTATQLRSNPETSGIKVVLITARAQEDDRDRGRQIGVDAYLTKPFDPAEMIRVVRELAGAPNRAFD